MAITIKTPEEIEGLREAGKRLAKVVQHILGNVAPGVTTRELDAMAYDMITQAGDKPAFFGYKPKGVSVAYPATLCISVNDEVVHGIPGDRVITEGDMVTIDCGLVHRGLFVDHAITVGVGSISPKEQELIDATRTSLERAIAAAQPGNTVGDIGYAVESFVGGRFGIVRELSGHGVGRAVHEDPYVPNFGDPGVGPELRPGMVIAIEPMLTLGSEDIIFHDDGYTVTTRDGNVAAHFEHTVHIGENGPEVLTVLP